MGINHNSTNGHHRSNDNEFTVTENENGRTQSCPHVVLVPCHQCRIDWRCLSPRGHWLTAY